MQSAALARQEGMAATSPSPGPSPGLATRLDDVADAARHFANLRDGAIERAAVLFLDPERRLLGRIDFTGTPDTIAPPLRAIVAAALRLDAAALILGHSHPGGDPTPSAADLAYTRALARVCAAVELELLDHVILAGARLTSLRALGLL